MSERITSETAVFKVVMAISERDAPPGVCVDIGYILSYDRDFVKILRLSRPRLEGEQFAESQAEEVSYGRTSVRILSLENELRRKNAQKEGNGKVVSLISQHKQMRAFKVSLSDAAPRSAHSAENA